MVTTKLPPETAALHTLVKIKDFSEIDIRESIRLHHAATTIYRAAFEFELAYMSLKFLFAEKMLLVGAYSCDEPQLNAARDYLKDLKFYPYGWTVEFSFLEDDCWLDSITFPSE